MLFDNKLKAWVEANIIDDAQRTKILEFEKTHNNGLFWRAAIVIAGLLIGFGVCLIVASNWDKLSTSFKICADFALFGAITYGAYYCIQNKKNGLQELFLLLCYLMIAATIGLLGQTFNLDGGWRSFALFWSLLGVPYILLSRSVLTNALWTYIFFSSLDFEIVNDVMQYFKDNLDGAILGSLLFLLWGFLFEKFDENIKRRVVLPYVFSKCFYILAYFVVIFGAGSMGMDIYIYSGIESVLANVYVFAFFGAMMFWGIKTQNLTFFKRNALMTEVYIFLLFLSRMGNLMTSGIGMIAGGLLILGLIYSLKKTSKYIGKMEVFK